jgi:hypothetical protein
MEALKKFGTAFFSMLLFLNVMVLVFAIASKDIVQNNVLIAAVKESIKEEANEEEKKQIDELVDRVASYPEVNQLLDSFLDDYVNYRSTRKVSDKTVDQLIDFFDNHKEDVEKMVGGEIDLDKLHTPEVRKQIEEGFDEVLKTSTDESYDTLIEVATTYNKISSNRYWLMLTFTMILLIVIIALIQWSTYKWMRNFGIILTSASIITLIIYSILVALSGVITEHLSTSISISSYVLLYSALIELIVGIALQVIHNILKNKEQTVIIDNNQIKN